MVQNQTGGIDPIVDDPIENVCSAKKDSCIPTAINKSDNGLPHLLIYNKVLKSGSTTLQVILRGLAETHNYDLGTDSMSDKIRISDKKHFAFYYLKHHYNKTWPLLASEHVPFINVEEFGLAQNLRPLWMSQVRDPVRRFISRFYFRQFTKFKNGSKVLVSFLLI